VPGAIAILATSGFEEVAGTVIVSPMANKVVFETAPTPSGNALRFVSATL
jgi:hypothetical protein